jgi:exonuclease VII large subunit
LANKEENMKRQEKIIKGFAIVIAMASLVFGAYAQNTAQQQQLQQQQMLRLQSMTQSMNKIMERSQNLVRNLEQKMTQVKPQTQNQVRALQQMGEGTAKIAEQMKGNLERWQEMIQNRELAGNREMTKDLNRIQNRLEKAANELDEMLRVMERVANRLGIDN